jgi:hypothetical protein
MSCIHWHTRERTVDLHGSERAWLAQIADGPARAAWGLDRTAAFDRAVEIMAMVPEDSTDPNHVNYLHGMLRDAQVQDSRNKTIYKRTPQGQPLDGVTDHRALTRFVEALTVCLKTQGVALAVAGQRLRSADVDLNTALVAGSDPVRVAAKLHGWCEAHCYVEGSDRDWLAGIITDGLSAGIYRHGLWYVNGPAADQPDRKWSDQGWGDVLALLGECDDGPVVLSYSVTDGFPNRAVAGYAPEVPEGWVPDSVTDEKGRAEWEEDGGLTDDYRDEYASDLFYALPDDERWRLAMDGLRSSQPWARLAPETLASVAFGPAVTVYDLFAPDRDERVRAAFAASEVAV